MKHASDLSAAAWRKSSYSAGGDNNCLEVADDYPGIVPVRDSKIPEGGVLVFGATSWASFLTQVKHEVRAWNGWRTSRA